MPKRPERRLSGDASSAAVLFSGLYLLLVSGLLAVAFAHGYQWVDGAWNAQVALNFAENGRYATTYPTDDVFSIYITTGQPVLLPAALLFRLFGATSLTAALVPLIYMCAALFALDLLLTRFFRASGFAPLESVLFGYFCTLGCYSSFSLFGRYAHQLLGEGATVFFFAAAGILLAQHLRSGKFLSAALCGAMLACALITKTVAICFLLVFALMMVLECLITRRFKKRALIFIAFGFAAAFGALELLKFFQLNESPYYYKQWWIETFVYSFGLSEGAAAALPLLERIAANIRDAADLLCRGNPVVLVVLLLIAPVCYLVSALSRLTKRKDPFAAPERFSLLALGLCGDGFIVAAILFTSGGMFSERRVLVHAVCFLAFVLAILVGLIAHARRNTQRRTRLCALACTVLMLFLAPNMITGMQNLVRFGQSEDAQRARNLDAYIEAVKALPDDAACYGIDWTFAAETALLCDIDLKNLHFGLIDGASEHYLLIESHPLLTDLSDRYELTQVYALDETNLFRIYRLSPLQKE